MNKSILSLIAIGIALSILHVPEVMITVGIISCLAILSIRLCWSVLQPYSELTEGPRREVQREAQRIVVRGSR